MNAEFVQTARDRRIRESPSATAARARALEAGGESIVDLTIPYRGHRDPAAELFGSVEGLAPLVPDGAPDLYADCASLLGGGTAGGRTLESDQDVLREGAAATSSAGEALR